MDSQAAAPLHRGPIERRVDFEWSAVRYQQLVLDWVAVLHLCRKDFPAVGADGEFNFTHGKVDVGTRVFGAVAEYCSYFASI